MIFYQELGIRDVNNEYAKIIHRDAVRAIIVQNGNILMVHSNKGDYKFPGGGVCKGETHEETLKREVEEETGYIINKVKDRVGTIIERNVDIYENDSIFEMTSNYYLCEISDKKTLQRLDEYEAELDFRPIWIDINEAISQNEKLLKMDTQANNRWLYREFFVLQKLKEYLIMIPLQKGCLVTCTHNI